MHVINIHMYVCLLLLYTIKIAKRWFVGDGLTLSKLNIINMKVTLPLTFHSYKPQQISVKYDNNIVGILGTDLDYF